MLRRLRKNRWQLGDTLRLAGGDLGDQAPSKPSALLPPSRTLSRALDVTVPTRVPTVVAGQVMDVNNRKNIVAGPGESAHLHV